jgi:hypothetical protein
MSKSTKQRWHADAREANIYDEDGTVVCYVDTRTDCRRIVSDHNACLGIESPATTVPELAAVCSELLCYVEAERVGKVRSRVTRMVTKARTVLGKTGKKP